MTDPLHVFGLAWLGVRTSHHDAQAAFFEDVLGMSVGHREPGMTAFDLADGSQVEVFSPTFPGKSHFVTGPVAGFAVGDLDAARSRLHQRGFELLGTMGPSWQHFRAPDGNVYELKLVQR